MSRYRLVVDCYANKFALDQVKLLSLKGGTATYTGYCPNCLKLHTLTRKAGIGVMRTSVGVDHRTKVKLTGTPFVIALPSSLMRHVDKDEESFRIGNVRFQFCQKNGHYSIRALDPIPAS